MKRKLKSVLALLLALSMALSLLCGAVWAAESDESSTPDASVQTVEEVEAPAPEKEAEQSAPSEVPEEEKAPEEEDSEKGNAPAEEESPAKESSPALENQEDPEDGPKAPTYSPTNLTVDPQSVGTITVSWTWNKPTSTGTDQWLLEGRDTTLNGSWTTVDSGWISNSVYSRASGSGSKWGDLPLISGNEYEFRLCYTDLTYTKRGSAVQTANTTTYYNSAQEKALLQEKINKYLTTGLDPSEGEDKVYTAYYDGLGLSPNQTALRYNRPLYQLDLTFTGSSTAENGDALLNFHAQCASRVPGDSTVKGLEFRMEGIYFINQNGEEQYQSLAGYDVTEDFSVSLSELGYGCNYIRPKMICYGYSDYDGVSQYWEEEPFCFGMYPSSAPFSQYSALTTKDTLTLKPCTNYSGTLTYQNALKSFGGNVSESGVKVWYRKKGASGWKEKKFKKIPKISSLKADTVYEWKAQSYLVSQDPTGLSHTLNGPESKVFTVCTALSAKPQLKSCKVSGAKVKKHTLTRWSEILQKDVVVDTYYATEFKVTYTFKKPSKNIKGYTSGGVYAPVKNGKVTFTMHINTGKSKKKAKKFTVKLQSCTNTNGPGVEVSGLSPTLKYSGKIK